MMTKPIVPVPLTTQAFWVPSTWYPEWSITVHQPFAPRFGRTLRGIVWFAAGCAVAAVLYCWAGLRCLIDAVTGAATAILHREK
jgi:hypothetical protein